MLNVRPRFVCGRHNFNVHSCWFILNFAEAVGQESRENSQVFHIMYILSSDYMKEGCIDRCIGVQEV